MLIKFCYFLSYVSRYSLRLRTGPCRCPIIVNLKLRIVSSYTVFNVFSCTGFSSLFICPWPSRCFFFLTVFRQNVPQECVTTHFCLNGSPSLWSFAPYFFTLFFSYSDVFRRPPPSPPLSAVTLCIHVQNVTCSIFKAVTAVVMIQVFWNITPFRLVNSYRRFGGACCHHV